MDHPGFFERHGPFSVAHVAESIGANVAGCDNRGGTGREGDGAASLMLTDVRPINLAAAGHLTFIDNRKYLKHAESMMAAACIVAPDVADRLPPGIVALVMADPYRGFARALALFYPDASMPLVTTDFDPGTPGIHPSARIEDGARIASTATVGPEAQIGAGSIISPGAVIGYRTAIGRNCFIGPNTSVTHALVGNRVIVHAGVQIGQDGFGFAMGPSGHLKVPQIGRVILQDDVEIGANSTIDRGALGDTVVGEGTKIDNLVQIAHNVQIGRHCVIVSQAGVSGSSVLEDFVVLGGRAAIAGHLRIGTGAQVAGKSGVTGDVPAGGRVGGFPALPVRDWARQIAAVKRLAERKDKKS